jgi:PAS domain S-box-containing protein
MTNIPGIDGVVVTTHPIKERKEMEDALRESNEKYRTLFESDPNYTVLVGLDGKILDINNSAIDFIGMPREELLNKKYTDTGLFSEEDEAIQIKNFANAIAGLDGEPFQCKISNKDGDESWLESQLVPLKKDGLVNTVLIIATDITTRKIATDKLKYSLNEKEILLNEIHHRVKNNMQIVSSLLNLQTEHLKDENAVNILKESQNRVRSMAMIHENLYKSKDFTYINFHDYVFKLTSDLLYSYNISQDKIRPELDIGEIKLNLETAVPCGLIISELVTNCIKHAFPGKENGILKLKITKLDDKFKLIIQDNGVGFPDNVDYKNTTSLGLQLVNSLVDQINGTLELIKNDGTKFQIIFEELKYKERLYNKDKNKNKNS